MLLRLKDLKKKISAAKVCHVLIPILIMRLLDRICVKLFSGILKYVGIDELNYSEEVVHLIDDVEYIAEGFMTIIAAWLADSWFGKYKFLLIGSLLAVVENFLLLLIFLPLKTFKTICYFIIWLCLSLENSTMITALPAFLFDQFDLSTDQDIFKIVIFLLVIIDFIAQMTYDLLQYHLESSQMLCFVLIASNIFMYSIFITYLLYKKQHFRRIYYYRVLETIIAYYYITVWNRTHTPENLPPFRESLHLKNLENIPKDIRESAIQLWSLIKTFPFVALYFVTINRLLYHLQLQSSLMSNENLWFQTWRFGTYHDQFTLLSLVISECCMVPILKKYFVFKSDLEQFFLALLFVGLGFVVVIIYQYKLDKIARLYPHHECAQIRIYNGLGYSVNIDSIWVKTQLKPEESHQILHLVAKKEFTEINVTTHNGVFKDIIYARQGRSISYIICQNGINRINGFDSIRRSVKIQTAHLTLISCPMNETSSFEIVKKQVTIYKTIVPHLGNKSETDLKPGLATAVLKMRYRSEIEVKLEPGGVYVIMIPNSIRNVKIVPVFSVIAERSSFNVEYLFIPIIATSLGATNFDVAMLKFLGTEVPDVIRTTSYTIYICYESIGFTVMYVVERKTFFSLLLLAILFVTNYWIYFYALLQYKSYESIKERLTATE